MDLAAAEDVDLNFDLEAPPPTSPKLAQSATQPLPLKHAASDFARGGGKLNATRDPNDPKDLYDEEAAQTKLTKGVSDSALFMGKPPVRKSLERRPPLPKLVSNGLVSLQRSVSRIKETYYCQICMGNEDVLLGYTLQCGHTFCHECIEQYLTIKINEAQITSFVCPHIEDDQLAGPTTGWACQTCTFFNTSSPNEAGQVTCEVCSTQQSAPEPVEPGCQIVITDDILANILGGVDSEVMLKYKRFKEMKENTHYRECPRCEAPNTDGPTFSITGGWSNQLTCGNCAHKYCYIHSDAHPDQTCKQYERVHRIEERQARALISQYARPCPTCKQPIEKDGGCNHMTCPKCQTDFCWLCGRKIPGGTYPTHYAPWNLCGCPNMQMSEDLRDNTSNRCSEAMMCGWRFVHFFLLLLVIPIGLACMTLPVTWFFVVLALVCACCPCIIFFMVISGEPDQIFEAIWFALCCPCLIIYGAGSD